MYPYMVMGGRCRRNNGSSGLALCTVVNKHRLPQTRCKVRTDIRGCALWYIYTQTLVGREREEER